MSLTLGSGPLGGRPGDANYTFQSPPHKILFQPDGRRLRAFVGDTRRARHDGAHLLHETGIPPVAYVPLDDFDAEPARAHATRRRTARSRATPRTGRCASATTCARTPSGPTSSRSSRHRGCAASRRWRSRARRPLDGRGREARRAPARPLPPRRRASELAAGARQRRRRRHRATARTPCSCSRRACRCARTSRAATSSPATWRRARRVDLPLQGRRDVLARPRRRRRRSPTRPGATSCRSPRR